MTPETLTVAVVTAALRAAEEKEVLSDFAVTLHADGSGWIKDAHSGQRFHTFDNLTQLCAWVVANTGWKTNACQLGLHPRCIYGPAIPCSCDCHKPKGATA